MTITIEHEPTEAKEVEMLAAFVGGLAPGTTVQTGKAVNRKTLFDLCGDFESVDAKLNDVRNVLRLFACDFEQLHDGMNRYFPNMIDVFRANFEQLLSLLFMAAGRLDEELYTFRELIDRGYSIGRGEDLNHHPATSEPTN